MWRRVKESQEMSGRKAWQDRNLAVAMLQHETDGIWAKSFQLISFDLSVQSSLPDAQLFGCTAPVSPGLP